MESFSDDNLLTDPRFWGTAGIALLVPIAIIGSILWAHDLRGSIPASVPQLAIVGAFTAAILLIHPFGAVDSAPAWLVAATLAALALGSGMLALSIGRAGWLGPDGSALGRMLNNALAFLAPAALAIALALNTGADRFLLFGAALVLPGAYTYALSLGLGTHRPPAIDGADLLKQRFVKVSRVLSILTWVTVAAILLQMIGDGWVAVAAIGALAALAMTLIAVLLLVIALGTALKRPWFPLALALALPASQLLAAWLFVLTALGLLAVAFLCVKALRKGKVNAIWAQARITSLLDKGDGKTGSGPQPSKKELSLFRLLYPFHWDRKRAQGAQQSGALAQTIAKLVAELSDSDAPPFFKSFLRVDIRPRVANPEEPKDRELQIRCFGVTGYASEEADPPVEDDLAIPFWSADRFAAR